MTAKKERKSTDEIQNGGVPTVEDRVEKLEAQVAELDGLVANLIARNHLLVVDR